MAIVFLSLEKIICWNIWNTSNLTIVWGKLIFIHILFLKGFSRLHKIALETCENFDFLLFEIIIVGHKRENIWTRWVWDQG
jgi:hypothetical protein